MVFVKYTLYARNAVCILRAALSSAGMPRESPAAPLPKPEVSCPDPLFNLKEFALAEVEGSCP